MLFKRKATRKLYNPEAVPAHVGIIMDGNGRWAKRRGMPRMAGHRAGSNALRDITKACGKMGMTALTVYAFSTENWKRPKEEVNNIMALLLEFLKNAEKEIEGQNVQIRVIGDVSAFSDELQREIVRVEKVTGVNDGLVLNIALNYGGRSEITRAVRILADKAKKGEINPEDITEESISECMYTSDLPDPDLIIRPSGEYRLSNFLIWQSAYSEFWFSDILWPDFTVKDLEKAIGDFQKRNRRFGGVEER
ncbi:MAG: isoprenyl transferase [Eubacteriales bacterium]|nr:isoprenyl transferase [Eubacteriales bacterium]